jgi:5-hydroxyisourate hydrolase-like protein (transthyretin family)
VEEAAALEAAVADPAAVDSESRNEVGMTFAVPGLSESVASTERETMREMHETFRGIAGSRRRLFVLTVLVAAAIATTLPARAHADYSVTQCVPNSVTNTDAGAVSFGAYSIWARPRCGTEYGLGLETGADTGWTANGAGLAWRFTAPVGTTFTSANATVHYGNDGGFAASSFNNGPSPFHVFATCGTPSSCWTAASANAATVFEVRLQCFKSPNCHSNWAYAWTTSFAAQLHDAVSPGVAASGQLLNGGVIRGVEGLQVVATDSGGGARAVTVLVNGLYSRGADFCPPNHNGGYTALRPCPDSSSQHLAVDTQRDPGWTNGPNDVLICSSDAGGNTSAPCIRRTVQVDNSCPGSGGTAASDLDAGADVAGQLKAQTLVTSKVQPVVRGSLRDDGGNPVAGATVCVYETIDLPDASRQLVSTATTQANGRFAMRLDAGPSRRLDLVYRFNDRVLAHKVQLDSRVVPTLTIPRKTLENGEAALFRGQVPGPNADGRAVAMQARVGRKWRTFKQLRTDSDGRFHGKYRFTQTRGRIRYVFRALVKRQSGYPYEPGSSRNRRLVVNG